MSIHVFIRSIFFIDEEKSRKTKSTINKLTNISNKQEFYSTESSYGDSSITIEEQSDELTSQTTDEVSLITSLYPMLTFVMNNSNTNMKLQLNNTTERTIIGAKYS